MYLQNTTETVDPLSNKYFTLMSDKHFRLLDQSIGTCLLLADRASSTFGIFHPKNSFMQAQRLDLKPLCLKSHWARINLLLW